jgi:tRNA modification GTPase
MDYQGADAQIATLLREKLPASVPVIDVWNKVTAAPDVALPAGRAAVHLSARTGEGLDALRRILLDAAGWQSAPEGVFIARERHLCRRCARVQQHLCQAAAQLDALAPRAGPAGRRAAPGAERAQSITGEFTPDDLLGVIFSKFCIGK